MSTNYRAARRAIKNTKRRLSLGLLTVAATSAAIPYKIERKEIPETGDDGIVLTSLLFRASISPKKEDSVESKTTLSVTLRPMKEVEASLTHLAMLAIPKKEEEPAVLADDGIFDEDEKLQKHTEKALKLEAKAERQRVKIAKRRSKLAKQRAKRAKR